VAPPLAAARAAAPGPGPRPQARRRTARAQAQLLDSLFGTERGLAASSEVRAEINELITQLEGCNPTPSLDQARAGPEQGS
jgi:hypothetical protein